MDKLKLTIKCFGAFRTAIVDGYFEIDVAPGQCVHEIKQQIKGHLASLGHPKSIQLLVDDSAFASKDSLCDDQDVINELGEYALLPPVCGG